MVLTFPILDFCHIDTFDHFFNKQNASIWNYKLTKEK